MKVGLVMLKVNNISKQFDNFSLSIISLSLDKGYILGLISANGSGKTTLLNILCGLNQADSGNVVFDNCNLYNDSSNANLKIIRPSIEYIMYYLIKGGKCYE